MTSRALWLVAPLLALACKTPTQKCAGGDLPSCTTLCDQGDANACFGAGAMYFLGTHGAPQSDAKAADFKDRACTLGYLTACYELGVLYKNGFHAPKDLAKAKTLLTKACDGNEPNACDSLKDLKSPAR